MQFTYQTRLSGHGDALSAYAGLYSRLERRLFARVRAGESRKDLKRGFIRDFGIPARMFNAMWASLQGKIKGVEKSHEQHADTLRRRIARAKKQLAVLERRGDRSRVHHKRRRLASLEVRLAGVEADLASGAVRLCFGSRKLWRKQFNLEANGYGSHREWLLDWWESRDSQFFVLGSRDETAGCQLCVANVADDGTLSLRLRMPDCLAGEHGRYLVVEGVRFAYGHEVVLTALQENAEFTAHRRQHGEKAARETDLGEAVSYRFMRDSIGWRVFVTVDAVPAPVVTDWRRGAVGMDLNADHLAVTETDSSGNWLRSWRVPLVTYGKSQRQAEALIGDAVAGVVEHARAVGKPIVIEKLDFRGKKAVLEGESRKYSRMLSSFSYGKIKAYFISPGSSARSGGPPGKPGLQFGDRPGEVHGTLRAQCPSGSGPGAGPSFAWLFGAHPAPAGLSAGQWRSYRLHGTREETREARVDVLGCGLPAVETGACSAALAGKIPSVPDASGG